MADGIFGGSKASNLLKGNNILESDIPPVIPSAVTPPVPTNWLKNLGSSISTAFVGESGILTQAWNWTTKTAWPAVTTAASTAATAMGPYWIAAAAVAVAAVAAIAWWRSGSKPEQEPSVEINPQTRAAEMAAARARSISQMGDNEMATTNHAAALAKEQALTGEYAR